MKGIKIFYEGKKWSKNISTWGKQRYHDLYVRFDNRSRWIMWQQGKKRLSYVTKNANQRRYHLYRTVLCILFFVVFLSYFLSNKWNKNLQKSEINRTREEKGKKPWTISEAFVEKKKIEWGKEKHKIKIINKSIDTTD